MSCYGYCCLGCVCVGGGGGSSDALTSETVRAGDPWERLDLGLVDHSLSPSSKSLPSIWSSFFLCYSSGFVTA